MNTGSDRLRTRGHHGSEQIAPTLLWLQDTVTGIGLQARQMGLQAALILCALGLLLWTAIFLYGSFYYTYMPLATYSTPVHYYYRTDCGSLDTHRCSFPTANVSLLRNGKKQVMTYGQPYRISLELEMPESPANQEMGMFMVKMSFYSRGGQTVISSARSVRHLSSSARFTMLRYHSGLLTTLRTLFLLPFFFAGVADQRQVVEVELFSEHIENSYAPSVGAIIEIQSQRVQIYSAQLYIHAHYTGIRYFLYHFPTLSAVMGVTSNFSFLSVLLLFSYLRFILSRFFMPPLVRHSSVFHQRPDRMDKSKDTDYDDPAEMGKSSSDPRPEACVTATRLSHDSILEAGGDKIGVRHRFQSEIDGENTIAKQGVENMGKCFDTRLERVSETIKQPDSTLTTQPGSSSCVTF